MDERLARGERVAPLETVRLTRDGRRIDVALTMSPIIDRSGAVIGASGIGRDITRRRRADEELRRSQAELRDFVENCVVGLHWVGPDGTILWANQAELDLLGYTRDEYLGRHIADFHADQDVVTDVLERLRRHEQVTNREARLRCKDGSIRTVLISSNVYVRARRVRPHPVLHHRHHGSQAGRDPDRGTEAGARADCPRRSARDGTGDPGTLLRGALAAWRARLDPAARREWSPSAPRHRPELARELQPGDRRPRHR